MEVRLHSEPFRLPLAHRVTGSPWGSGTFAGSDGSRQASAIELEVAEIQGKTFYETISKVKFT